MKKFYRITRQLLLLTTFLSISQCLLGITQIEVAKSPGGSWKTYASRTISDIDLLEGLEGIDDKTVLNKYGGLATAEHTATGFFRAEKIDGRWWLIDPEGSKYLHKGVVSVSRLRSVGAITAAKEKFGGSQQWANDTTKLLRENGFTGVGAWSDTSRLRKADNPLAYTQIWNFMSSYGRKRGGIYQKSGHMGYPNDCLFVFDPEFEVFCDNHAKKLAESKDDPWLLGHFSDNELPLWRSALRNYLELPATDHGHLAAKKWLVQRYGPEANFKNIVKQDEIDFLEFVADKYFHIVSSAIKKYDPNHLFLGSRLNGRVTRYPEVFRAAGKYLDVVAVNYYWAWTPDPTELAMWSSESGKPILITEWYAKGMDSGLPNRTGAGWTVKTQKDRGSFYQNFTLGLLESKVCVGWDWFKYADNDPEAMGVDPSNIDSNKGIVSNRYQPYHDLLKPMREINDYSHAIIDTFDNATEITNTSTHHTSLNVPTNDIDNKVEKLLSSMTLLEKIGQMTQVDSGALENAEDIKRYHLGSILSGGSSDPKDNLPSSWLDRTTEYQSLALKTRLKIPLLYGIDAVHGHNNIQGAVIFPHNIGLGATHNPQLVLQAARTTAIEVAGTGMHWIFAPCIAVAKDIRWGRTYESFSDMPDLVGKLGLAAMQGIQQPLPSGFEALACAKHFVADGGTTLGIDQGDTQCDEATLREIHIAPYLPSIEAGVGSIMVSYSSWNGEKLHGHKKLLTDVLKGELGYKGFLISDYAAIDQLPGDYRSDIKTSINAGLDMVMIPYGPGKENNYPEFISLLEELVISGEVKRERIDDAVRRILRQKYRIGLFEHPFADPTLISKIGCDKHREIARDCVRQSMVVLRNNKKTLPLSRELKNIAVVGQAANDLGMQCGGWTIGWQGEVGNVVQGGTTLLEALRSTVSPDTKVSFESNGEIDPEAEVVIVVIGEEPYAEGKGDRQDVWLSKKDRELIELAKKSGKSVVTVLYSGRPMVLGSALENSDAFIAAWLPGTEGKGIVEVLFGDYSPTGKLPRPWPRTNNQLTKKSIDNNSAQFPRGHGVSY